MARVEIPYRIDMDAFPIVAAGQGAVAAAEAGRYIVDVDPAFFRISVTGTALTYDAQGRLADGVIGGFFAANNIQVFGGGPPPAGTPYPERLAIGIYDAAATPASVFVQAVTSGDARPLFAALLAGDDTISGGSSQDVIRGFDGNDRIVTMGGDRVFGGTGNDTITDDSTGRFYQGSYLRGEEGNDSILGGAWFDDVHGNTGDDTCAGGEWNDWVVGGQGNDLLHGDLPASPGNNFGNDVVYGNLGDDTCAGGFGDDVVRGGQGDDSVSGGEGRDFISGDRGNDTVSGGAGADIFHGFRGAGVDRVVDFNAAEGDRVQLLAGTSYVLRQEGADAIIDLGGGERLVLVGVSVTSLSEGTIFLA